MEGKLDSYVNRVTCVLRMAFYLLLLMTINSLPLDEGILKVGGDMEPAETFKSNDLRMVVHELFSLARTWRILMPGFESEKMVGGANYSLR